MIVIVIPAEAGAFPSVVQLSAPDFMRLAVIEAFRAGDPLPVSIDEAAAYLRSYHPLLWAFPSPETAELWADHFTGPRAWAIRHAVRAFLATSYSPQKEVAYV